MKNELLFIVLLFSTDILAEVPIDDGSSTLCNSTNEQIIFSCPIAKINKILSVCGSLQTNKDAYVEYRFGRKNKIELSYQSSKRYPYHQIFLNQADLRVGQHDTIYFQNKKTGYRLSINTNNQSLKKSAALSIYKVDSEGYKLEQEKMSFMCDSPVQESLTKESQKNSYLIPQTDEQLNDWVGD